jgi:hypothetical protein
MQRIIKRFLLHHRETDDSNSIDFEELKQDLKMIRYEMNNDMKKTKDDIFDFLKNINIGLNIIGDQIFTNTEKEAKKFIDYKRNILRYNKLNIDNEIIFDKIERVNSLDLEKINEEDTAENNN